MSKSRGEYDPFDAESVAEQLDLREISAIIERLKLVIANIVVRHRSAGEPLTWRLMHAIEDEAFDELSEMFELKQAYVDLLRSSPLFPYPKTDEPVNFGESNALPAAFSLITEAYTLTH